MIIGKSGSGKSYSLRNFDKDEVLFINVMNKPLPFRGRFKDEMLPESVKDIVEQMKSTEKKIIVLDDLGYISTNYFMSHHRNKKGNASFDMYDDIADMNYTMFNKVRSLQPDKIVYFIMHEDTDDFGNVKPRTIGKLLDNKVCLEGMCTVTLRCVTDQGQHYFLAKTDGADVVKAPPGMFEGDKIDNDLKLVDKTIREFYEMEDVNDSEAK